MKNVVRLLMAVLVVALASSTLALGQGGADTYKSRCAMCHGPDGKGDTAMGKKFGLKDLGSAEVQGMSDADLNGIITKGKDKMPEYGSKLSKEQIDDLVKFIRSLKR
ncbi:MAG TPA: cytochrome c [Terriglobales bacterium]|jgi:mono/diheme cytochrome c family protein